MFTVFSLMLLTTMVFTIATQTTYAQDASTTDIRINHLVTVYDGGMVIVSDTIKLSKKTGQTPTAFSSFQLGFPNDFRSSIYQVWAYEGQNTEQRLAVDLDTGLGIEGFYGVRVHFTNPVDLNSVNSFSFTVVYEFSDLITESTTETSVLYNLAFPVYPSLTQEASSCNSTVVFPSTAYYASGSPAFNLTTSGTPTLVSEPLEAFTFESGNMEFTADTTFNLVDMTNMNREISLNDLDTIVVSDFYAATSRNLNQTSSIWTLLPANASNIIAEDDIGNKLTVTSEAVGNAVKATVTLKAPVQQYQTAYFLISFDLPWKNYVIQNDWSDYTFKFKLFEPMNVTVTKANVTLNLPEGSQFQSSNSAVQLNLLQSGIYSKTPVFSVSNISSSQNLDVEVSFKYAIFWSSFRPTLWAGVLVAIVGIVAFLWQTVRAAPAAVIVSTTLQIHPEELRNYVKTYEEITKLQRERESLETRARRGKIPRRLYRVRSRTLESRISLLSRDLATLREKIRSAGPRYSGMMRQIEVANTELQAVEADIERTEARYKRGEISAVAYHKLLEDYLKRKDRAQTNIDGVLLRLREE
jgi:hypothetical protein